MADGRRAAYASHPARSHGRLFDEPESAHRSAFQRDRDRIIHSSAFRRLKHKTQVFVEHEGDYYRTRLTHTLEVAQIARTLARTLRLDEDLAEAVALAHDLGHTPFGHTGEDALADCLAAFGGFDHNDQALKIVTRLECHYADFDGLNLTWETLEGLIKHNGPLTGGRAELRDCTAEMVSRLRIDPSAQAGAEAQVAALSDDIAYVNHDLHDGLRAGLFSDDEAATLPLVGPCYAEVDQHHPGLDPVRRRHEAMRRVFGLMVEDVLQESERRLAESAPGTPDHIRALSAPVVDFSSAMWGDVRQIKQFLFARMYRHFRVKRMRVKADLVVRDLFRIFHADPTLLPDGWREAASAASSPRDRARVVGDYIAGMTDRFALEEHRALTDPAARA